MVVKQAQLDAFGPISRRCAEALLKPGYTLLRRSPNTQTPNEWYLTCRSEGNEIQNYRISRIQGGMYIFSGRGSASDQFASINDLVNSCATNRNLPFDIKRRITPFSIWGTRLQIIRSSIAPMLKYKRSP